MEGRESPEFAALIEALYEDMEPSQAFELGRDVEALLQHPGWVVVQQLLAELRSRRLQALTRTTKPLEASQYSQELGFLNGVQTAQDAAQTVLSEVGRVRERVEREVSQAG